MFFCTYLLCSYNHQMARQLLLDCWCYEAYRTRDAFERHVINERRSYMACLCYYSKSRKRVNHRSVPILLGSYIDYVIRGRDMVLESRPQWGSTILRGVLKIYASFSTFDALSLHVRETRNGKHVDWYTYVDDVGVENDDDDDDNNDDDVDDNDYNDDRDNGSTPKRSASRRASRRGASRDVVARRRGNGLALSYRDKIVSWTYCYESSDSTRDDAWVALLHRANPFRDDGGGGGDRDNGQSALAQEYIELFDALLSYPYNMNDLKNRQFLNGATIMNRYIAYDLNRRRRKKAVGSLKMSQAFEQGSLYQALSKRNFSETDDWCKSYPQNYDNTMHEGKSNKIEFLLPNVMRAANEAVRNSNALAFPTDGVNYFCMLNTKDLKSAGEQNVLADFVMMTEETDQQELYRYLRRVSRNYRRRDDDDGTEDARLIVNGFIVGLRVARWTLADLVSMKHRFGHVTTKYYPPYVMFSTRASIPVKYSQTHDACFSAAETAFFGIEYPERDMLSIAAKTLPVRTLRKTAPAKATVSINNIKGSVANVTSEFHRSLMENNLGVTCYMNMTPELRRSLIDASVLEARPGSCCTLNFERCYEEIAREFDLTRETCRTDETSSGIAMRALSRLYPANDLLVACRRENATPFVCEYDASTADRVSRYLSIIFNERNYPAQEVWNLRLRAVFGNPFGACIEDGVVLDERTARAIPPIRYNACITVDFTFRTNKQPKDAHFVRVLDRNDGAREDDGCFAFRDETLIGCVITPHEAFVKNSKHSVIKVSRVGSHYYYLLHFVPKRTRMYTDLRVESVRSGNALTVVIKGSIDVRVVDGSKKNVCTRLADLRDCWGVTKDGRKVHAQIVYSEASLLGRVPAGQLYEMLVSPELAIGPRGEIIAPIDLVLHTLHPYTNVKIFDIKVDTLTNINGFDAQNLACVSGFLRRDRVRDRVLQVLGLHGYRVNFDAVATHARDIRDDDDDDQDDETRVPEKNNRSSTLKRRLRDLCALSEHHAKKRRR